MIDTDSTGQRKLDALVDCDDDEWTDWERTFIKSMTGRKYGDLTPKQKTTVGTLYDKLVES